MNVPSKKEIRQTVRQLKNNLSEDEKSRAARQVLRLIEHITAFNRAKSILVYHSLPDELSTNDLIAEYSSKKLLFLPRVNGDDLDILPYSPDMLEAGAFNIKEPTGDNIIDPTEIDVVIVPGVAFDLNGNRVGRGKGYYDRLLARTNAITIGVGYDFQLFESFEVEPHDKVMDYIVTERQILNINHIQ